MMPNVDERNENGLVSLFKRRRGEKTSLSVEDPDYCGHLLLPSTSLLLRRLIGNDDKMEWSGSTSPTLIDRCKCCINYNMCLECIYASTEGILQTICLLLEKEHSVDSNKVPCVVEVPFFVMLCVYLKGSRRSQLFPSGANVLDIPVFTDKGGSPVISVFSRCACHTDFLNELYNEKFFFPEHDAIVKSIFRDDMYIKLSMEDLNLKCILATERKKEERKKKSSITGEGQIDLLCYETIDFRTDVFHNFRHTLSKVFTNADVGIYERGCVLIEKGEHENESCFTDIRSMTKKLSQMYSSSMCRPVLHFHQTV